MTSTSQGDPPADRGPVRRGPRSAPGVLVRRFVSPEFFKHSEVTEPATPHKRLSHARRRLRVAQALAHQLRGVESRAPKRSRAFMVAFAEQMRHVLYPFAALVYGGRYARNAHGEKELP